MYFSINNKYWINSNAQRLETSERLQIEMKRRWLVVNVGPSLMRGPKRVWKPKKGPEKGPKRLCVEGRSPASGILDDAVSLSRAPRRSQAFCGGRPHRGISPHPWKKRALLSSWISNMKRWKKCHRTEIGLSVFICWHKTSSLNFELSV